MAARPLSLAGTEVRERLIARIRAHTAHVGVVGLGYVGLPFAVEKAKVGFPVTGIEQNPLRAAAVNRGEHYIPDVKDEELAQLVRDGRLRTVTTFDVVPDLDVIVICVPTPLTKNLTPDLQYIENVTREIARRLRPGQLISLESTTYPGTTDGVMRRVLKVRASRPALTSSWPTRLSGSTPATSAAPPRTPTRSSAAPTRALGKRPWRFTRGPHQLAPVSSASGGNW